MASVSEHCLNEIKPIILKSDKNKDRQYSIDEIIQLLKKSNSKCPERLGALLFKSLNKKLDESICFNDIDDRELSKNCDKFKDKPELDIETFLLKFNKNNDKMISHHELKTKLEELGCTNSKKTADYVFEKIDINKEGSLSFENLENKKINVEKEKYMSTQSPTTTTNNNKHNISNISSIANQCNKRIAMVCASNQNRSLEAHHLFVRSGFKNIRSFGTSTHCKLPGPSIHQPNIFSFGTPYQDIYTSLKNQDQELYIRNGLLNMLERNISVKLAPEKWQEEQQTKFEIVYTFDQRVYDAVIEDLLQRDVSSTLLQPVHIINLQVKDTHEEAVGGAQHALEITSIIEKTENWEEKLDQILEDFYKQTSRQLLHTLMFY
ncbi:hypothetical protein RB653_010275 [Dictyostelium firmibasis]|uniref:protein-serine/threonine phosphatase n=1 Tax=Dictyostelium firmibasis TaxID=79012 RepID=A0AAN7TSV6_9MYCE